MTPYARGLWPNRNIFYGGLSLLGCALLTIALGWLWLPEEYYKGIVTLTATRIFAGRPGGVYLGFALGLDSVTVIIVNFLVDAIAVMILYPMIVLSTKGLLKVHFLDGPISRIQRASKKNQKKIERYGIGGLFLFVVFPAWGTGPVVGCVIGYFMGLASWLNICVVLGATLSVIILWAFLSVEFYQHMVVLGNRAIVISVVIIVIIIIGTHVKRLMKAGN